MSEDHALSADLKGTEALLAALRPQAPTIDRDRLMYEAGAASARRAPPRFGFAQRSVATIAGLAASLMLGVWIGDRQVADIVGRIDFPVPVPTAPPVEVSGSTDSELAATRDLAPLSLSPNSYLALRKQLAALEIDFATLPKPDVHNAEPDAAPSLRRQQADWLRTLN